MLAGKCRIKTEQAQQSQPTREKPERNSAAKTSAKTPASSDAKPKPRAKSGMDKTERDVHHVLYKLIGQVKSLSCPRLRLCAVLRPLASWFFSRNAFSMLCQTLSQSYLKAACMLSSAEETSQPHAGDLVAFLKGMKGG